MDKHLEDRLNTIEDQLQAFQQAVEALGRDLKRPVSAVRDGYYEAALTNAGSIIEALLRDIWIKEKISGKADAKTIEQLFSVVKEQAAMDRLVEDYIRDIQLVRNRAAHGEQIVVEDSVECLRKLAVVLEWYCRAYPLQSPAAKPARAAEGAAPSAGAPAQAEPRRKQVTLLSARVCGYAELSEAMDPEDLAEFLDGLWGKLNASIAANGGRVVKNLGDSVLALWGAEAALEDDPERAVLASLDMQKRAVAFASGGDPSSYGSPVLLKIGVHTGPVLLTPAGGAGGLAATGETVSRAARLEGAAPPGGVLISEETFKLVQGTFEVQLLSGSEPAATGAPARVYLVEGEKAQSFREETRGIEGLYTPMVDRESELKSLREAYDAAVEDGETQFVTILGDPGVGKSRLLHEFFHWFDDRPENVLYFKARAHPSMAGLPYSLARALFSFRFDILESDTSSEAREKFESGVRALVGTGSETEEIAHLLGHLLGFDFSESPQVSGILGDPRQIRQLALHCAGRFFELAAGQAPCVVFLDDLHWADDSTIDLINHVTVNWPELHALFVGTARPGFLDRHPAWGEGRSFHHRIDLNPLSKRDTRKLVGVILQGAGKAVEDLEDLVIETAEGNPYFAEEIMKMLMDRGVLVPGDDRWTVDMSRLKGMTVPPSLTGVLQARFDGLPEEERRELQAASVVGRVFWDSALDAIDDGDIGGRDAIAKVLGSLRQKGIVLKRDASAFEESGEFMFKHALFRDVAYESVLKRKKKEFHLRVASWISEVSEASSRRNEYLSLIAEHYEKAGEEERAAEFFAKAGEFALGIYAFKEANELLKRAQALFSKSPGGDAYARMLLLLGESSLQLGLFEEAEGVFSHALALSEGTGDKAFQAEAYGLLAQAAIGKGTFREVDGLLAKSLDLARSSGDARSEAKALYGLGDRSWRLGELEKAIEYLEDSLAKAKELDDKNLVLRCLHRLGSVYTFQGDRDRAMRCYEECRAGSMETGNRDRLSAALTSIGLDHRRRGEYALAREKHLQALEIEKKLGRVYYVAMGLNNLGFVAVQTGDLKEAARCFLDALEKHLIVHDLGALIGFAYISEEEGRREKALKLLGLVLNHPASDSNVLADSQDLLEKLRKELSKEELDREFAKTKGLPIEPVIEELIRDYS